MSFDGDADILISTSSDAAPLYLTVASETDLGNVSDDDCHSNNRLSNLASLSDTMGHDDHLDYDNNNFVEPRVDTGSTIFESDFQGNSDTVTIPVFEMPETQANYFLSKEDAIKYVNMFATSNGFSCSIKNSNPSQIWLQCTCSGSYRPHRATDRLQIAGSDVGNSLRPLNRVAVASRVSSSLKTNCPFAITINYSIKDYGYHILIKDGSHNHQAIPLDILGKNRLESLKKYHGNMIFREFENGLSDKDILLRVRKERGKLYGT